MAHTSFESKKQKAKFIIHVSPHHWGGQARTIKISWNAGSFGMDATLAKIGQLLADESQRNVTLAGEYGGHATFSPRE